MDLEKNTKCDGTCSEYELGRMEVNEMFVIDIRLHLLKAKYEKKAFEDFLNGLRIKISMLKKFQLMPINVHDNHVDLLGISEMYISKTGTSHPHHIPLSCFSRLIPCRAPVR